MVFIKQLSVNDIVKLTYRFGKEGTENDSELLPVYSEGSWKLLGAAPRLLCHRLGLIHKVVYLIIINEKKELLIQIRGDGRIDVPVGGHVSAKDKSDTDALIREAHEEIGITLKTKDMKALKTYFQDAVSTSKRPNEINRELRVLYLMRVLSDNKELESAFSNRSEKKAVKMIRWITYNELQKELESGNVAGGLKYSVPYITELYD